LTLQDRRTRRVELPDPDLSPDELVARATAMRETLRARQDECEELGRLPDATAQDYVRRRSSRLVFDVVRCDRPARTSRGLTNILLGAGR
jgi:3-hydroxy-9,10-secoandrosta-1,3,5(10)-triene-9,17-dione monooxygenase